MYQFHTQHMIPLHTQQQPHDMVFDRFYQEMMAMQAPSNWSSMDTLSYTMAEPLGLVPEPPSQPVPINSKIESARCRWTEEEKSLFLEGLQIYGKGNWKSISSHIKSKIPSQVSSYAQKYFLRQSVPKVTMQVPNDWSPTVLEQRREILNYDVAAAEALYHLQPPPPPIPSKSKQRMRWSIDEQRLFLIGLKKYGKGDWRNISEYVGTKTSSQVVSHAQKYFLRQTGLKKRKSINDMIIEESNHGPDPHLNNHHDSAHPLQNGDLDMIMKETNDQVMVPPHLPDQDLDLDFLFNEDLNKLMDEILHSNLFDPNNSTSTTELDPSFGCCNTFSFGEEFDK